MKKYILLRAENEYSQEIRTVLVDVDEWNDETKAEDYFTSQFKNAVKIGEVEIDGDYDTMTNLDIVYESN